jgi:hypothetical protein
MLLPCVSAPWHPCTLALRGLLFTMLIPALAAAQTGAISGFVRADGSGAPLAGVMVQALSETGSPVAAEMTDATGSYTIPLLPAGTYLLVTINSAGYVDEFYDNVPCHGFCYYHLAPGRATPVVVTAGATASGRNFSLSLGGSISGRVVYEPTSAPLQGVSVYAASPSGALYAQGFTDAGGNYQLTNLPAGSYIVYTSTNQYQNEAYDNVPCPGPCLVQHGFPATPVPVVAGGVSGGRNFALLRAGRISGVVTSEATGLPIEDVEVYAYDANGRSYNGSTDAAGAYAIGGLPTGSFVVATYDADAKGFVNEYSNNQACPIRCYASFSYPSATRVTVAAEGVVTGISFALGSGGGISGAVSDALTGAPLPNVEVTVQLGTTTAIDAQAEGTTDASGAFSIRGLPPGTYYAYTRTFNGYLNEIYPDLACLGECDASASQAGRAIVVTAGATTSGVSLALSAGGRVSGTITDAVTMQPLANLGVYVYDAQNRQVARGSSDASGAFVTGGLAGGTYYAVVQAGNGHLSQIYGGVHCGAGCLGGVIAGAGTPIVVTAGATAGGKDFALTPGGRVRGTITREDTGQPMQQVNVRFYDAAGRLLTGGTTDQAGMYESSSGLLNGAVFAAVFNIRGFGSEVYNNRPCADNCASIVASGTPIPVASGAPTTGIDFALAQAAGVPAAPVALRSANDAAGIRFSWSAAQSGAPAASFRLEAGFAPGTTALTIPVTGTSYVASGVPPGRFYLRVRGVNAAGPGPASAELVLTVGAGGLAAPGAPQSVDATMVGRRLVLWWWPPIDGGTPSDYVVEAGSATGLTNIATLPVGARAFTYDPVPNGFYFLRVRSRNAAGVSAPSAEVMVVAGGVASPPGFVLDPSAVVNGSTVTLGWVAPPGVVTGYVIEAGSAPGLSNLAVLPVGNITSISFPGIPPGTYYVRVRAENGLGRGVASREVVIVVG